MRRLRDEVRHEDPDLAVLARLVAGVGPLHVSEADQQAEWRALANAPRGRRTPRSGTALVLVIISLVSAVAAAGVVGSRWVQRREARRAQVPADRAVAPSVQRRVARAPANAPVVPAASQPEAAPVMAPPPPPVNAAATRGELRVAAERGPASDAPAVAPAPRRADAPASPPLAAAVTPASLPSFDPGAPDVDLVLDAVAALRRSHEPARALRLLTRYRQRQPHGLLAEDALALSIEAAAARGDPLAADLARRYLAQHPHGRFRVTAEQAIGRFRGDRGDE
jgi:hypothetical protein